MRNEELFNAMEDFINIGVKLEEEFQCMFVPKIVHIQKEDLFAFSEEKGLELKAKRYWLDSSKENYCFYEVEYRGMSFRTKIEEQEYMEWVKRKGDSDGGNR